ncbi:MAG: transcriptional regulator, partial [Candidatus Kapabacteria bacterium]|nr:transcriptional regulator [Candidatus Kapabacteria bacterium]
TQKKEIQKENGSGKEEKEKLRQKKKNVIPTKEESVRFKVPKLNEVQEYFASQKFPPVEASKFYNYFQSNGWLVGGRTKMNDWQAAARNWMLNANKFAKGKPVKPKAKHLHATTSKNYNEPL